MQTFTRFTTSWPKARTQLLSFVILLFSGVAVSATRCSFLTLPVFIILLALVLPYKRYSFITRLVIAGLFLFCANCALGVPFWLFKHSLINPLYLSGIWAVLLLCFGLVRQQLSQELYAPFAGITKADIAALAVASIVGFCMIAAPLLGWATHGDPAATLIKTIGNSGDNINHLEIIKGVSFSHGYVGDNDALRNVMSRNFVSYPQGWHLNVVIAGAFLPFNLFNRTVNLLFLYQGAFALTCMSFAYLFCLMMFEVLDHVRRQLPKVWLLLPLYALLAWGLWFFDLVIKGFPSFIMSLTLLLLLFICLYDYISAKTLTRSLFGLGSSLLVLGALGVTWLFILPPAALFVGITAVATLAKPKDEEDGIASQKPTATQSTNRWTRFFHPKKWHFNAQWARWQVVLGAVVLPFLLFQPYIQTRHATTGAINTPGSVQHLDTYIVMALGIIIGMVVAYYRHVTLIKLLGMGLLTTIVYVLWVSVYQHATIGHQEYYFYKTLYVVLMVMLLIAVPAIISGAARGYEALRRSSLSKHQLTISILLGCCVLLLLASHQFAAMRDYARGKTIDGLQMRVASSIVASVQLDGLPPIFVGDCNHANDYLATHLVDVLADKNDALQHYLYTGGLLATSKARMIEVLRDYHRKRPNTPFTIISLDRGLLETLQLQLGPQDISYIDLDNGKPKDQAVCQYFVH